MGIDEPKQRRSVTYGLDSELDESGDVGDEGQPMQTEEYKGDEQHEVTERPAKHQKRTVDKQKDGESAGAQLADSERTGTPTTADQTAEKPYPAATADAETAAPLTKASSLVRQSSRQPKLSKARQASSAPSKAAAGLQASESLETDKPPRKFNKKRDKEACAAEARTVWPDVPDDEWGKGKGGTVDDKPAAPITDDPPQGAAAVGWGFWQYFNNAPGPGDAPAVASDAGDGSDSESGSGSSDAGGDAGGDEQENNWFRGKVYYYDRAKQQYWCCMEDGESYSDQDKDDWLRDIKKGEVIMCRLPIEQQQQQQQQKHGQQALAGAAGRQQKKRKRSNLGPQQQQQQQQSEGMTAAADAPAVKVEGEPHHGAVSSQEPPETLSASAALALVMPSADRQQAEPCAQQEHKPVGDDRKQQQQQKQPSQRKGVAGGSKARQQQQQQQQQPVTSPRAAGPAKDAAAAGMAAASDAAAAGGTQRPRSAVGRQQQQQQQLDLSSLDEAPRMLAEHLQELQHAHSQLRRAQQQVDSVLQTISRLADADAVAFASIVKEMRHQLDSQQQQQQQQQHGQPQTKQVGPGTKLCFILKTIKEDTLQQKMQAEAARCLSAMQQQQQRKAAAAGTTSKQQQQHNRSLATPVKVAVKQELPPTVLAEKHKQEKEAAAAAAAAAAEIATLQAALKKQETALAAAEAAVGERSQDLQLLDRFRDLVPLQLLDSPLRDKAVAMLAALLQPPAFMSPFAIAHQIEALLHEQHGLVGTGKHMYLQHLHLIWSVLGGRELEAAADAALRAEQQAAAVGQSLDAADVALSAKRSAEAAVAAAKAAIMVEPGIADPATVRGALLEGKLTVPDLFHETAATLGFDQQRDK